MRDLSKYDRAGNVTFSTQDVSPIGVPMEDRASYYAADGRLWATDTRTFDNSSSITGVFKTVFEEYRGCNPRSVHASENHMPDCR